MNFLNKLVIELFTLFRLVDRVEDDDSITLNNFTIINFFLIKFGPMTEVRLTTYLLLFQLVCTGVAFLIRYPMASYFYDP